MIYFKPIRYLKPEDTDDDIMKDGCEAIFDLDPFVYDSKGNLDVDGITNG